MAVFENISYDNRNDAFYLGLKNDQPLRQKDYRLGPITVVTDHTLNGKLAGVEVLDVKNAVKEVENMVSYNLRRLGEEFQRAVKEAKEQSAAEKNRR